jgi:hypothetical protein
LKYIQVLGKRAPDFMQQYHLPPADGAYRFDNRRDAIDHEIGVTLSIMK